jgi:hypothetical protein
LSKMPPFLSFPFFFLQSSILMSYLAFVPSYIIISVLQLGTKWHRPRRSLLCTSSVQLQPADTFFLVNISVQSGQFNVFSCSEFLGKF